MSDTFIQHRGPAPVAYSNEKLAVRTGSPAFQKSGNANQKVEIRGLAQQHTMGKKLSTGIAGKPGTVVGSHHGTGNPGAAPATRTPARAIAAPTLPTDPRRSGAPAVRLIDSLPQGSRPVVGMVAPARGPSIATTKPTSKPGAITAPKPVVKPLLRSDQALLLAQMIEFFAWQEQAAGRGDTQMMKLAEETLGDLQALLPDGMTVPFPHVEPLAPKDPLEVPIEIDTPATPAPEGSAK